MKFDYLIPAQGPVIEGLEDCENIIALEQPEYLPLRTLPGQNGASAIYRCEMTAAQREAVAKGADVLIEILHFGGPLAPSRVMILDQADLKEPPLRFASKEAFIRWFAMITGGPYL